MSDGELARLARRLRACPAAVLILGGNGVAAAAAAGMLLTVTGTIGGLLFAAWSGLDRFTPAARRSRRIHITDGPRAGTKPPAHRRHTAG